VTSTLTQVSTGTSVTIKVVTEYNSETPVPNVVHIVLTSSTPDFTVKLPQPRRGRFVFLCATESAALTLRTLLIGAGPFTLADTVSTFANTTFMVTGNVSLEVDPDTRRVVLVGVDYTATTL
jgi:hypothetical protein